MSAPLGWCNDGDHDGCWRTVVSIGGVHAGEKRHCGCTKPGCKCAEANKERESAD